ncbi:MAG: polyphenol oxidase family protein [Acidobacteriota bacterium]|nr:polyphenol oxidase family protein [Acidobacteriota bacterium]
MELASPFHEYDGQIALDLPGACAVFTTRSWGDVRETEQQIAERLGVTLVRPRQVHGDAVLTVSSETTAPATEADAVVSATRGLAPMVITADCLPIVIASRGAVAAVHAGWRGLAAGLIGKAVAALRRQGGGVISAAIGPGAGVCCYEVGDDLHRRFNARCQDFHRARNLDLKAIARVQLMEAGVARIHDTEICTICGDPGLTFSHRREGAATGRQAAIVWSS